VAFESGAAMSLVGRITKLPAPSDVDELKRNESGPRTIVDKTPHYPHYC